MQAAKMAAPKPYLGAGEGMLCWKRLGLVKVQNGEIEKEMGKVLGVEKCV